MAAATCGATCDPADQRTGRAPFAIRPPRRHRNAALHRTDRPGWRRGSAPATHHRTATADPMLWLGRDTQTRPPGHGRWILTVSSGMRTAPPPGRPLCGAGLGRRVTICQGTGQRGTCFFDAAAVPTAQRGRSRGAARPCHACAGGADRRETATTRAVYRL